MEEIKEGTLEMLQPITLERELTFLQRLARLLSVKSLVTLILTGVFAYLSMTGVIVAEQFQTIFTVIISFYFGTQAKKE
jgi:hypothetical protein